MDSRLVTWVYSGLPLSPRRYSGRYLFQAGALRASGIVPAAFHRRESPWQMAVPVLGRLWTRRLLGILSAELPREGFAIDRIEIDRARRLITVHARLPSL
jgi:hypothetical protein